MRSKNNQPTAAQVRWREAVRDLGSVISGGPAVIHHPVGQSGRHQKQHIGNWWIIPLTDDEHKQLHAGETFGYKSRKEFEKEMFVTVIGCFYFGEKDDDFPSSEVLKAIDGYHL